jgi:hypothetical protein
MKCAYLILDCGLISLRHYRRGVERHSNRSQVHKQAVVLGTLALQLGIGSIKPLPHVLGFGACGRQLAVQFSQLVLLGRELPVRLRACLPRQPLPLLEPCPYLRPRRGRRIGQLRPTLRKLNMRAAYLWARYPLLEHPPREDEYSYRPSCAKPFVFELQSAFEESFRKKGSTESSCHQEKVH